MSIRCFFLIFFFITIYSCDERKTTDPSNNCICSDLILDKLYNHFYLNNRTIPFTGTCEEYHKNGNLFQKKEFIKGKIDGTFLEYTNNNILIKKWIFSKNIRQGESFTYSPDGTLIFHGIYKNGKLDSTILSI